MSLIRQPGRKRRDQLLKRTLQLVGTLQLMPAVMGPRQLKLKLLPQGATEPGLRTKRIRGQHRSRLPGHYHSRRLLRR